MKKLKKPKGKDIHVKVTNECLNVTVADKPYLLTLFKDKEVLPNSSTLGPLGGIDLTGYSEYRLTLHIVGQQETPFSIQELFGPAGEIDQVIFDIGSGQIGPKGILNYRAKFDIYGPRNFFIQITNNGTAPFQVNGTLYAVG